MQHTGPTVSAVITTYNYGRFIGEAIECVLQQTLRPDEIIVVDDGSTDGTADIVSGYAGESVRYIWQENAGPGAARNAGIRASTCDLVAFLDADDRWVPEKTALQVEHFVRYPSVGLVSGSEWQVQDRAAGERERVEMVRRRPASAERMYHRVLVENMLGNPSLVMVRRVCFDRVGMFDESMRFGQDWEMWIRIARRFPVGIVDACLIYYNIHSGSLTFGKLTARVASNREIHRRYIGAIRSPLVRLRLLAAANSMSLYYAAAGVSDEPQHRWFAIRTAALALLLDPAYKTWLKSALLFRTLFGRTAFNTLRDLVKRRNRQGAKNAKNPPR